MKNNVVITNLFNNLDLPVEMKSPWESQYLNFAKKCNADFINFSITDNGNISKHYAKILSETYAKKRFTKKMNQLAMLDEIDKCFSKGYEWVFAMDADMIINPDAEFDINQCNKDVVYFYSTASDLDGKVKLIKSMKKSFLKKNSIKYGNQGVLLIHKSVWRPIKNIIFNYERITRPAKDMKGFFGRVDQNIMSIALTLKNIKINKLPNRNNLVFHFVGKSIEIYKDIYKIDPQYFDELLKNFKKYVDTTISDGFLKWAPLLFRHLELTEDQKQTLWSEIPLREEVYRDNKCNTIP
jgi:hypothetical protein